MAHASWITYPIRSLLRAGRADEAARQAQALLRAQMREMMRWTDLAGVYVEQGHLAQAERTLDEAIRRFDQPFLYSLRAYVKHQDQRDDSALDDLRQAERAAPDDLSFANNIAAMLFDQKRYDEALPYLQKVLARDPTHDDALSNLSLIYAKRDRLDEAVQITLGRLERRPGDARIYLLLLDQLRTAGQLDRYRQYADPQRLRLAAEQLAGRFESLLALTYLDDPLWHQQVARRQARAVAVLPAPVLRHSVSPLPVAMPQPSALAAPEFLPVATPSLVESLPARHRLHIGYWSSDFYDHATAQLITEVFELHDRDVFEISILSYGKPSESAASQRIRAAAEHYEDFYAVPDDQAAARIAALGIDILVDLKGYTSGARMAVPYARPAPIIVSWLGYPGTLGSAKVDYLIGDDVVTPLGCEAWYDERIIRLPACYQPNDRHQSVAWPLTRAEYGLPEGAVALAAFNATHKISPEIFDVWLRALKRRPQACLWLFAESRAVFNNLAAVAQAQGVPARQLVHAGKLLPRADHIARYRAADLALDTFPYGSHTTGSDALRAGCPLLALQGRSFASRVSASLLSAAGLPELICPDLPAYEALLDQLIVNASQRQHLRERLNRPGGLPLFDTPAFTRSLERAYLQMWQNRLPGANSDKPTDPAAASYAAPQWAGELRTDFPETFAETSVELSDDELSAELSGEHTGQGQNTLSASVNLSAKPFLDLNAPLSPPRVMRGPLIRPSAALSKPRLGTPLFALSKFALFKSPPATSSEALFAVSPAAAQIAFSRRFSTPGL